MNKIRTLEEELLVLKKQAQFSPLSIADILLILSGKGRPLLILLLSLPFCQPIQLPGLSTPFGLAIAITGLRTSFGKHIWLPQKLLTKQIPAPTILSISNKALSVIKSIKPWIHPRLFWFNNSPLMQKLNGIAICLLGLILALPLPIPLSNLTAAWSIFFISIGIIEDDGVFTIIGYTISLLTFIFFSGLMITASHLLSTT